MTNNFKTMLKKWETILFPAQNIYHHNFSKKQQILLFAIFLILFSFLGFLITPGGLIGFDWINFFGQGRVPPFYPPWTNLVVKYLSWPLLIGITLSSFGIAALKRSSHPLSLVSSFLCLPLLWTIFIGQLEGVATMGLLWMPWLAPLALIKPQVTIFAFLTKKNFLIVVFIFLLFSLILWGLWPLNTLNVETYYAEGRYIQNIGLGLWGIPLALIALWLSRGDMDMLMLSGCFLLPHLIPYNLLPVAPAIARLKPINAIIALLLSWTPFLANFIGPIGWWFGWLFIIWLWCGLASNRYPESKLSQFFAKLSIN